MKKIFLTLAVTLVGYCSFAQTNIFPTSGSVGIGTTSPSEKLVVSGGDVVVGTNAGDQFIKAPFAGGAIRIRTNLATVDRGISLGLIGNDHVSFNPYLNIIDNGNVGIGTTSPLAKIDVNTDATSGNTGKMQAWNWTPAPTSWGLRLDEYHTGSAIDQRFIQNIDGTDANVLTFHLGNVGIGTTTPTSPLTIIDNNGGAATGSTASFNSNLGSSNSVGNQINVTNSSNWGLLLGFDGPGVANSVYHSSNAAYIINVQNAPLNLGTNNSTSMTISNTGNVGIGTTTPDAKLAVKDTIHTQEVKVDMTGWNDFVFDKGYPLPTLSSVKTYIDLKGLYGAKGNGKGRPATGAG